MVTYKKHVNEKFHIFYFLYFRSCTRSTSLSKASVDPSNPDGGPCSELWATRRSTTDTPSKNSTTANNGANLCSTLWKTLSTSKVQMFSRQPPSVQFSVFSNFSVEALRVTTTNRSTSNHKRNPKMLLPPTPTVPRQRSHRNKTCVNPRWTCSLKSRNDCRRFTSNLPAPSSMDRILSFSSAWRSHRIKSGTTRGRSLPALYPGVQVRNPTKRGTPQTRPVQ